MRPIIQYENTISEACPRRHCFAGRLIEVRGTQQVWPVMPQIAVPRPEAPTMQVTYLQVTYIYECTTRTRQGCPPGYTDRG